MEFKTLRIKVDDNEMNRCEIQKVGLQIAGYTIIFISKIYQMSSPQRIQVQLEQEIKRRINQQSPSKGDLDFYIRKVRRLEGESALIEDQLSKVRVRLRRAEDFQIKYELLLVDNASLKKDLEEKEKKNFQINVVLEKMKNIVEERRGQEQSWINQKKELLEEIGKWTDKAEEAEKRRVIEVSAEKAKAQEAIRKQKEFLKRDFEERQEQYTFQIRQLKKVILEKQTVEAVINGRVEKIRRQKDEQIQRLSKLIEDERDHFRVITNEKNQEIDKLKEKFQKMINFELENIKKNLDDQDDRFRIELNGLREIISIKNDEINKLLKEVRRQADEYAIQKQSLQKEVNLLKDKIYVVEKESELELTNMKQRLTKLHSIDLRQLEKRYESLLTNLRKDKEDMQKFLKQKERLKEEDRKEYERAVGQLNDKIKERDQRINSLTERIKESGDVNTGELKNLHASFHKIQGEKEALVSQYQSNIQFMTQQIAKLTSANELKNSELKKFYQDMHEMKRKYEEQIKELEARTKKQRKQRQEERDRERTEKEKLSESVQAIERQFKNTERRLERERQKEERQKNKLKFIVQELQKDVERLNKYIKSLDENLKNEYKRSQMNIIDGDGARRQLTATIQKQKIQLQNLKKIEVEQIKRKFDIDSTRLINQNDKLKTELLNKSLAYETLESQFKKLDYNNKNIERINKQKLMDYEKKMATLNNEINLTQNLYQAFIEAKSRAKH